MSLHRLSKLLPLPEGDLQQILEYAATLSSEEAAEHFRNLLGDSSQTQDFILAYDSQIKNTSKLQTTSESKGARNQLKNKGSLHKPTPRKALESPAYGTAYQKKSEGNYMVLENNSGAAGDKNASSKSQPRAPPSAAGPLISDFARNPSKAKTKAKSKSDKSNDTRNNFPTSTFKTKVFIPGGQSMHGASTTLSELDAVIRSLEISTNSTLKSQDPSSRACNCIATRHPLLIATPNCLACGKVVCIKEGLGPCTFCGTPLLSAVEVQAMISSLKKDRESEKILSNNRDQKRAELASTPKPFCTSKELAETKARAHRDRLLGFQAQNAKRTTIRDEVADFNTDRATVERDMMWASPVERAMALKRQQSLLQEMEWNARPEYERRKVVVSLDVVGGKVIKKMGKVEKKYEMDFVSGKEKPKADSNIPVDMRLDPDGNSGPKFSRNPLLGDLIRPIWKYDEEGREQGCTNEERKDGGALKVRTWRRVQDDQEDNEELILDGGLSR